MCLEAYNAMRRLLGLQGAAASWLGPKTAGLLAAPTQQPVVSTQDSWLSGKQTPEHKKNLAQH